jgi:hypothetical protein
LSDPDYVFFVNSSYSDEVTLDGIIDDSFDSLDITWRILISEILCENVHDEEFLQDTFGVSAKDLDRELTSDEVLKYYSEISFYEDNRTGNNVGAFELIRNLEGFPTDKDGNGSHNGVELSQSTANGPRKYVHFFGKNAEKWLIRQFEEKGIRVEIIHT